MLSKLCLDCFDKEIKMNMNEKILATATTLFETRGIQASGVDTIIAEAGIAKANAL